VCRDNLDRLARVMRPGAELRLASDDADYVDWMLAHLEPHAAFVSQRRAAERPLRPADWIATRYEAKALKRGVPPAYLSYRRR
jgi:tRNA (guanine-N7-)-methyltransferase